MDNQKGCTKGESSPQSDTTEYSDTLTHETYFTPPSDSAEIEHETFLSFEGEDASDHDTETSASVVVLASKPSSPLTTGLRRSNLQTFPGDDTNSFYTSDRYANYADPIIGGFDRSFDPTSLFTVHAAIPTATSLLSPTPFYRPSDAEPGGCTQSPDTSLDSRSTSFQTCAGSVFSTKLLSQALQSDDSVIPTQCSDSDDYSLDPATLIINIETLLLEDVTPIETTEMPILEITEGLSTPPVIMPHLDPYTPPVGDRGLGPAVPSVSA